MNSYKMQYVAFHAPPEMVAAIDSRAQEAERSRAQELRFLLRRAINNASRKDEETHDDATQEF